MREPPARVRFIGHPLVSTPIMGLCGFAIYAWSQNPGAMIVGVGGIVGLMWTMRAQNTMNQYRRWKRAWDSMGEPAAPRQVGPLLGKLAVAALVVGGFALAGSGAMPSGGGAALGGLVLIGAVVAGIVGLAMLGRRLGGATSLPTRRRKNADQTKLVRIAQSKPILPAPDLKAAYDALPAHSWQVIEATRK